ncbi:factor of DNA methylation 5-like isoform X2 [Lotus japonicus]|uniref:factor of DNA methylation 5-like isoform X2 n=1 Tax=Lotus japonicus TaxID=34305 RepID=UPI00258D036D|nr:factor of DNA methylation 5-like isoform X2 [Lotus japonicus]
MGSSSSATDSEVKESDKYDYMERYYDEIKAGKYRTKNPNATLRCPFCEAKKKQEFQFKDLLQHASGIGTCSAKRSMQVRVKHLALEKYLKQDVSTELDIVVKPPQYLEVANEQPSSEGRFVWPWKGIVASIFRKPKNETEEYWLRKFELYKPKEAHVLHGKDDPRGYVVLEFGTEWTGYRQVMKLDTDFQTDCHGKKDWDSMMECPGSDLYAWIVGAEEYNSEGMVGDYLREKAVLKTVSEVSQDLWKECTEKVETNYSERSFSLMNIMAGREELTEAHIEEMQRMEQNAREHARRIIEETEYLKNQIYTRNGELARLGHQLSEKEKSTIHERRKFEEEKKKITESLILASEEQVKAKDDIAEVLKKHKMEEKAMRDTLLKLEKDLNDEHKLKIEIAELDEQLKVLNCMNVMGADSEKGKISKKEIEEMEGKLEEIIEKMSEKEDVNQVLEMKEQLAKKELEDAREAFIAEELHPHFSLPKVIGELFNLAKTLFGIEIEPADGLAPVWNNDVKFFHVKDSSGSPIAYFYFDPYSRPAEKRQGAWMDEMFARSRVLSRDGTSTRFPVAHMLCNQTSSVGNKPSLMTFCEKGGQSLTAEN